eukprot:TRINITY_DN24280_c0_g1_i2.p1 TRINITY_DN24280_c0_g1~~TRINITY_DN24280_c0_g1_i2.p1  ORF type:complete len:276 (+),score=38.40 TRINITY_DN24280_c0_g1_i2:88-915(+)
MTNKIDIGSDVDTEDQSDDFEISTSDSDDEEEDHPVLRRAILVMMCIVQAYATTNGPLRHKFKHALHISDSGAVSEVFNQAATFVQWGKFAMTLGQNVILGCISTKSRVYIAMALVFVGSLVVPVGAYAAGSSWLGMVFLAYGLIGLGLGVFECTFLSVITPLGKVTKAWAIMGFPAAFGFVNVGWLTLVSYGLPVSIVFWYIALSIPLGAVIFSSMGIQKTNSKSLKDLHRVEKWRTSTARRMRRQTCGNLFKIGAAGFPRFFRSQQLIASRIT